MKRCVHEGGRHTTISPTWSIDRYHVLEILENRACHLTRSDSAVTPVLLLAGVRLWRLEDQVFGIGKLD